VLMCLVSGLAGSCGCGCSSAQRCGCGCSSAQRCGYIDFFLHTPLLSSRKQKVQGVGVKQRMISWFAFAFCGVRRSSSGSQCTAPAPRSRPASPIYSPLPQPRAEPSPSFYAMLIPPQPARAGQAGDPRGLHTALPQTLSALSARRARRRRHSTARVRPAPAPGYPATPGHTTGITSGDKL
jgi:hypothetical protein